MWPVTLGRRPADLFGQHHAHTRLATGHIAIVAVLSTLSSLETALLAYSLPNEAHLRGASVR